MLALAATRLIEAIMPVAYFAADPAALAWLSGEALRIWVEHGPGLLTNGDVTSRKRDTLAIGSR